MTKENMITSLLLMRANVEGMHEAFPDNEEAKKAYDEFMGIWNKYNAELGLDEMYSLVCEEVKKCQS